MSAEKVGLAWATGMGQVVAAGPGLVGLSPLPLPPQANSRDRATNGKVRRMGLQEV